MAERARNAPLRLHQHGYAHTNHEPTGRKCEFGRSRSAAEQAGDVAAGQRRLADAFGRLVDPVFTPPWNRCSPATADALVANGVHVLSRDHSASPFRRDDLYEVPVTVDWFAQRKHVRVLREEVGGQIAAGVRRGGPVGVMLHHAAIDETERATLGELLCVVHAHPGATSATIAALAP